MKKLNKNLFKKYEGLGKVVKLTKEGRFVATYKNVCTAGLFESTATRRIYKCCIGQRGATKGFRWMFQEEYFEKRKKNHYFKVEKQTINKAINKKREVIGKIKFESQTNIVPAELAKYNNLQIEKIYELIHILVEIEILEQINYQNYEFTELFLRQHKFEDVKELTVYD